MKHLQLLIHLAPIIEREKEKEDSAYIYIICKKNQNFGTLKQGR